MFESTLVLHWGVIILTGALSLVFVSVLEKLWIKLIYRIFQSIKVLKNNPELLNSVLPPLKWIFRWTVLWIFAQLLLLLGPWSRDFVHGVSQWLTVLSIGFCSWAAVSAVEFIKTLVIKNYSIQSRDNLGARKAITQYEMIQKVLTFLIVLIGTAAALMTFDGIRQIGVSLLASAGIAGLVMGFAAQKTLGAVLAGIQVAFTQPIRIDDAVLIENEWGWVEEINLTYVVVRLWDLRRLVVPVNYFIEKPFQNWTRTSANLIGSVIFGVDFNANVESIRSHIYKILNEHPLWDKKVWSLQVTDFHPNYLELRALMSAEDSSKAWDLRCFVREKIYQYLNQHQPQAIPKTHVGIAPHNQNNSD